MKTEVIMNANGIPDIMVSFSPEELGLPDTLRGRKVESYLISKYQATVIDDVPYSLPFQVPENLMSFDRALNLCESKGPGWHLITNDEWMALAHQSRKNNTLPHGNTDLSIDFVYPEEQGVASHYDTTLTGSGPVTWNHDHTSEGVADMCGNVWEYVGGVRILDGKIQVIPNNEAAAGADQSQYSQEWTDVCANDGFPIRYVLTKDHNILLSTVKDRVRKDILHSPFTDIDLGDVNDLDELVERGFYPANGYHGKDYFYLCINGERVVCRGGSSSSREKAGVFSLNALSDRSHVCIAPGFRAALVRYAEDTKEMDQPPAYDVTEVCPYCESEVTVTWNSDEDGYAIYCPHCGRRIMLCDACKHSEDNKYGHCDWSENGCFRKGNQNFPSSALHVDTPSGPIFAVPIQDDEAPGIAVSYGKKGSGNPGCVMQYDPIAKGVKMEFCANLGQLPTAESLDEHPECFTPEKKQSISSLRREWQ